jgi:hypothetical protein
VDERRNKPPAFKRNFVHLVLSFAWHNIDHTTQVTKSALCCCFLTPAGRHAEGLLQRSLFRYCAALCSNVIPSLSRLLGYLCFLSSSFTSVDETGPILRDQAKIAECYEDDRAGSRVYRRPPAPLGPSSSITPHKILS